MLLRFAPSRGRELKLTLLNDLINVNSLPPRGGVN